MKYLIDSDYVVDHLKGRPAAVTLLDNLLPEGFAISIITFAEVYEGIYYGTDPRHYQAIFRRFLRGVSVLGITRSVAYNFARLSGELRAQGQSIPTNDLFIAATALNHKLTLVTRNTKHFQRVPHLTLYQSSP